MGRERGRKSAGSGGVELNNRAVRSICSVCGKERVLPEHTYTSFIRRYEKYGIPKAESDKCSKCRHDSFIQILCNHCSSKHLVSLVHFMGVERSGPSEYPICKKCGKRISELRVIKAGITDKGKAKLERIKVNGCTLVPDRSGSRCELNIKCPDYDKCLSLVISKNWVGWSNA